MLDSQEEYQKMSELEDKLWWYRILHSLAINEIKSRKAKTVLDAGCGTGGLLSHLREINIEAHGFDISNYALNLARAKGHPVIQSDLLSIDSTYSGKTFDCIVCNDALCYLEPAQISEWFNKAYSILKPNGACIINYPALSCFKGTHDISVGIRRRLNLQELSSHIDFKKFKISKSRYWPFFLSPLILLTRSLQRLSLSSGEKNHTSDVKLPPIWLNEIFYSITNLELAILPTAPFGSSLFLVIEKI